MGKDTKDKSLVFVFSDSLKHVYLLKKIKPKWQEDFLNGTGGKRKEGEPFVTCAIRETKEEINVKIDSKDIYDVGVIEANDFRVRIFAAKTKQFPKQMEDEKLVIVSVKDIPKLKVIPNLRMLIPYCQYVLEGKNKNVHEYMDSTLIIKIR